jgi:TolB-like protein/DNA-binding winged helix-turn-helix (wHTH) protein/Tfp pilus assembly protein PilF
MATSSTPGSPKRGSVQFGAFELDLDAGELRKHGIRLRLSGQPFEILTLLLEHSNQIVTREEIKTRLWPDNTFVDFEHSLNAAVNKLRDCLGDSATDPQYIETLPRRGYRLRLDDIAQNSGLAGPQIIAPVIPQSRLGFRGSRIWIALAASVLAAILIWKAWPWRAKESGAAAANGISSVLVLPFENTSHDPEQDYFADGMTEALITNLGKLRSLRVISRITAFQYRSSKKALPEIARDLNVDGVLTGSVLRSGSRVRINVQLVDPHRDRQLWAESYERELRDVLALQSGVASDVVSQIKVQLTHEERAELASAGVVHPQAYEYVLLGNYYLNRRLSRPGSNNTAMDYYQKALALDPNYAAAYAGLAEAYLSQTLSARTAGKARDAARRALELDDRNADAHAALGVVHLLYEWDWRSSEREFRRALELNPGLAEGHAHFAVYWWAMGKPERALEEAEIANRIDPLSVNHCLGRFYYFNRQYDRAAAEYQKVLAADPDHAMAHFFLGIVYTKMGREKEAVEELERASDLQGDAELARVLRSAFASGGYRGAMRAWLDDTKKKVDRGVEQALSVAIEYARLGEKEQALNWLERAADERSRALVYEIRTDPQFDILRDNPRYRQLIQRIGLPK